MRRALALFALLALGCAGSDPAGPAADPVRQVQLDALREGQSPVARWGSDLARYVAWHDHTNRLVPVYTYGTRGAGPGIDLESYTGGASIYRDPERLRELYGRVPQDTLARDAAYLDQTQVATLQRAALAAGRRRVIVIVFDGMDWDTLLAAATVRAGEVRYCAGRGSGLGLQDYDASGTAQFGFVVTAPDHDRAHGDPDSQRVVETGVGLFGGYDPILGGPDPWTPGAEPSYIIASDPGQATRHAVADSASAATAIFAGVKTYVGAINVDAAGRQLRTVAHEAQERGFAIGIVTSVPVSHATPAAAYAHNVTRADYQDLTRDLLGLRSVSHPDSPLSGVDVVIGCGHGVEAAEDRGQGRNFVPGNRYVTAGDLERIDARRGGRYVVTGRRPGTRGGAGLAAAAAEAVETGHRLFALYGIAASGGHLPYRTADGDYRPVPGRQGTVEAYSSAELRENPTLAEMTAAALAVLSSDDRGFWLLVEAGDVDWANHDANLDNSIGAVHSGDDAVRVVTDWVDSHGGWDDTLMIVTADHGHYLVVDEPAGLLASHP